MSGQIDWGVNSEGRGGVERGRGGGREGGQGFYSQTSTRPKNKPEGPARSLLGSCQMPSLSGSSE